MGYLFKILTFFSLLILCCSTAPAACLVPSDHLLMQCTGVSNAKQYHDISKRQVSLADQFIEQDDNDDKNAHYYYSPAYTPLIIVRKPVYRHSVSGENKHLLIHYAASIKDTLGIPYLLYRNFLI